MYYHIIAVIYSFSDRFLEKMLLNSECSECWTFERSLHIIKMVLKTFIAYIFDILNILCNKIICHHSTKYGNITKNHIFQKDFEYYYK